MEIDKWIRKDGQNSYISEIILIFAAEKEEQRKVYEPENQRRIPWRTLYCPT
jgi:hypothetical protein